MIKTRITELLGIKYPIVGGGMQWVSRAELAAAISEAGGMGLVTAASHATGRELRAEIDRVRRLTDKPFGVNISMLPEGSSDMTPEYVEVVIQEKVPVVETSGRSPEPFVGYLKDAGIKLIHKVPSVRFARKAQQIGADAVTIVGFECGGHPGMDDVTTLILVQRAAEEISIPILAGGGMATGRALAAALALGAEGVVMGTRFVATEESIVHANYKQWMIDAGETDTTMIFRSVRNSARVINNEAARKVLEMEKRQAPLAELLTVAGGKVGRKALMEGDLQGATFAMGQGVGLVHDIKPVKQVIEDIMAEAEAVIGRLYERIT